MANRKINAIPACSYSQQHLHHPPFCSQSHSAFPLLSFPFSPSVFVWKEERGATSLIGEGRRPRCESWGFISGRNVQLIIKVRLTDQQLHRETKENTLYCLISLCLSASSSPFFFSSVDFDIQQNCLLLCSLVGVSVSNLKLHPVLDLPQPPLGIYFELASPC